MYHSYVFRDIDDALPNMMWELINKGHENGSRNGVVKELTHVAMRLDQPWRREITREHRKANLAAQIAESAWVLAGRNDIQWLSHYLPRAKDFSDDGEVWRGGYGPRIRSWEDRPAKYRTTDKPIDQLQHVVELLRRDPLTRQAVISIYDPAVDTEPGKDIPCNNWISFTSRLGKLDMHVALRSNDAMWGWSGINAFEWSVLQEVVAGMLGIGIGAMHFSIASFHLYEPHWGKAMDLSKLSDVSSVETTVSTPRFDARGIDDTQALDQMLTWWFNVEAHIRKGDTLIPDPGYLNAREGELEYIDQVIADFPEPMFRSWLSILRWWWTGNHDYLKPLAGTRLEYAAHMSIQPPKRHLRQQAADFVTEMVHQGKIDEVKKNLRTVGYERVVDIPDDRLMDFLELFPGTPAIPSEDSDFLKFVIQLHNEKHEAYGNSWKRRGEMVGILANIARKIDRLGGGETSDETTADTAIDLLVYLAKYDSWLYDWEHNTDHSDGTAMANKVMRRIERDVRIPGTGVGDPAKWFNDKFDMLEEAARNQDHIKRGLLVVEMLPVAYSMARYLWETEQETDPMSENGDYRGADHD